MAQAEDARFMAVALTLGRRGLGNTWPNPAVGAVVVKDGTMLGRGWTQPGGRPHAETIALRHAGKAARGATLYVTLEPCSHQGKTPPCADAVIRAGISRVVSAMQDPNPEVAGEGHKRLQARGIAVDIGTGAEEAARAHAGHIRRIRDKRPHVLLKLAVSADGKIAAAGRKPVVLTEEPARARTFLLRAQSDAILVGMGTVMADNPSLTCRLPGMLSRSPVRVVLDARLRVPLAMDVVATARETPTWIFAGPQASPMAEQVLRDKGVEVVRVGAKDGILNINEVLGALAERGITRLMVEGGARVAASFVSAGLVDEAVVFHSPKAIGPGGIDALEGMALQSLTKSRKLRALGEEMLGADRAEFFERA
ncbi:MAG TPA: bifunctional diaminohydroxyphosphoribosylaminopyrimidine deaminase/5-amino-6-(5-phosphoribosylamino)uracil reductase RibD [Xanthobacteraceae bacterium]|nr:bifunctional diaminohydroxyphosphoribosylaminopyrimidine deaminase/5-amino-6-(5-phosphoribosylamino)uracil reductase RibD [Xanthobacteraceae bacterium]